MPININFQNPYQQQVPFYMGLLQMPGLTDDQRQAIIAKIQGVFNTKGGFFTRNPYYGLQWPTTTVTTPGNPNAPAGGVGADVSGQTIQAPPSGGAFGTPGTTPPPAAPGPAAPISQAPISSVAPASAPSSIGSTPSSPSTTQALGTTMPGVTFQGPPSTSQRFVAPAADMMQTPVNQLPPQTQQAIQRAVGPQAWAMGQGMTLGEFMQLPGVGARLGMAMLWGGTPGGPGPSQNAPGGAQAASGVPAPSGMGIFGQRGQGPAGGPQQAGGPQAGSQPGTGGLTRGDVLGISSTNPDLNAYLSEPLTMNDFDMKTFMPNLTAIRAGLDDWLKLHPDVVSPTQSEAANIQARKDTAHRQAVQQAWNTSIKPALDQVAKLEAGRNIEIPSAAVAAQRQAHAILANLRQKVIPGLVKDGTITPDEARQWLSSLPQSYTPAVNVRPRTTRVTVNTGQGKIPENVRIGIDSLQGQINAIAAVNPNDPRLPALQKRLQAIYDQYGVPSQVGSTTRPEQPADVRRRQGYSARYEAIWNRARATFPKDITDALQRVVHGQGTAADGVLLNDPVNTTLYPSLGSTLQQLSTYYRLLNPSKQFTGTFVPAPFSAPTAPASQYTGKTVTLDDGTRWASNGTTWTQVQ